MIRKLLLFFILLNTVSILIAQNTTISGVVIGAEDNLPMPGVTVVVEETTQGTITDFDGNFTLEVASDSTLVTFSFIGYEPVKLRASEINNSKIVLKAETIGIEEVVISVPYGTQKKETFTGSVAVLQSKQIDQLPVSSFEKSFQGNVSGVLSTSASGQPGSGTQVRIRGIGSISAGSEPLYVLDGIPISSQQLSRSSDSGNETSTSEASNVNVLAGLNSNDIESISILKDAAATSLYGSRASNGVVMITTKKGKSGKTSYSFRSMQGVSSLINTNLEMLNTDEYLEIRKEALQNANYTSSEITRILGTNTVNTNWFDEVYNYGYYNTYELSASGGSDKTTFYLSGSMRNDNGIVVNTGLSKYSGCLNVNHVASERVTLGAKVNVSYTDQDVTYGNTSPADPIVGAYILPPNMNVENSDGSYNFSHNGNNTMYNVIAISELNQHVNTTNRIISNVYLKYNITPKITFKTIFNYDKIGLTEDSYLSPQTPDGTSKNGVSFTLNTDQFILESSNTLHYSTVFKEKHSVNFLVGYELESSTTDYLDVYTSKFPNDAISEPGAASNFDDLLSHTDKSGLISYISNIQYDLKNTYYLSGSFRRDGSSKFSENNKWGNFWSVGFSWRLSEESFLKDIKQLNSLKLRGSVGTSGNSDFGDYKSLSLYGFGYDYNGESGAAPEQLGNPNLTWEKNFNYDLGVDFRIFKQLAGSIEYYYRKTFDLLIFVPQSATTGFSGEYKNDAEMINTGIELTLHSENIRRDNFSWKTDFTFAHNKNEITKLYNGDTIEVGTKIRAEGEALQTFYLPEWAGVDAADGSAMWYDENGNITKDYNDAAKIIAGTADPKFTAGLSNALAYKNISISFLFYLNYGNLIYNAVNENLINDGANFNYNQVSEILDRWQEPGDVTDVPKLVWNNGSASNATSTRYLEDGSYLRLKNITLSYKIGQRVIKRTQLRSMRFYIQAQNLWTWTKYSGLDPEQNVKGLSRYNYPNVRTFAAGLDINF